jgi:hypothetical protein
MVAVERTGRRAWTAKVLDATVSELDLERRRIVRAFDVLPGPAPRLLAASGFLIFGATVSYPPVPDAFLPNPALRIAARAECTDDEGVQFLATWVAPGSDAGSSWMISGGPIPALDLHSVRAWRKDCIGMR